MQSIQRVPIDAIRENPGNPRIIKDRKFDELVKSIRGFPNMLELRPVIVDETMMILGGNRRWNASRVAGLTEIPIIQANGLTDAQKREFIIKDNLSAGEWNWDVLANDWETHELTDWGLQIPGFHVNPDDLNDDFTLNSADREPFQQMSFTLADEQARIIRSAIDQVRERGEIADADKHGNENSNGNALFQIVLEWVEQNK